MGDITVELAPGIDRVAPEAWDACAGSANPFVRHAFLLALELSGSVGPKTGWQPRHLLVRDAAGQLVGAAPLYVKAHSMGEYVFDHAWAQAYERAGGAYYPKLQVAVPFTPVTGPRLLIRPDADPLIPTSQVFTTLARALSHLVEENALSSVHVTFLPEAQALALAEEGWLIRLDRQFQWENRGYTRFEDFLDQLSARKRKAIRRERAAALACGVRLRTLTGDDLKPAHWDAFHRLYLETADRKWGGGYLTRDFFHRLGATMADAVVLVMGEEDGEWVAGALNLIGGPMDGPMDGPRDEGVLYGRNWGSDGRYPFLHFEACYYRAIDFAIERRLSRVEAGAQGEHKLRRGYLPAPTHSAHWIRDPGLRRAIAHYLDDERVAVAEDIGELLDQTPYRREGDH